MLKSIYVIDWIIDDLAAAKPMYDKIFGTEPLWFNPDMAPGRTINAMYYQMPGPVGHVTALGFIERSGSVEAHTTGAHLLGIQSQPLDQTVADLGERGIKYIQDDIEEYAVGRNILTEKINGVGLSIAEHSPGGHDIARKTMFTKDGINDFGDASQGGLLDKVEQINIAVNDIEEATKNYTRLFGEPVKKTRADDLDIVYFAAPGDGFGVRHVALVAARTDTNQSAAGARLDEFLKSFGEGIYQVGYLITNLDKFKQLLGSRGLHFSDSSTIVHDNATLLSLPTIDKVDHYFIQK